jgi:signal transduction histidine kinase
MGRQLGYRLRLFGWALSLITLGVLALALLGFVAVGTVSIAVWVGLPILLLSVRGVRLVADAHRRFATSLLGEPVESPYLKPVRGNLLVRLRAVASDPATWRDLVWLLFASTVGLLLSLLALVESVLDLIFWWLPPGGLLTLQARLCRAMLRPTDRTRSAQRIQQLTESRALTVDTNAAELRRIERDLHDGAQARLVAIGMNLGLAEELLARDPESARQLLTEARESNSIALAELRDLVRGIHPPVLADRGLVGAVQALALAAPVPVEVHTDLDERLAAPVESAAYFSIAEALANVIKHSGADQASVRLGRGADALDIQVQDNGVGGADAENGTGLRGIARRLAAFDGTLTLTSPTGGPTTLVMVLPCALSSPKTLPSSGTA